jgi:hypothetical protein
MCSSFEIFVGMVINTDFFFFEIILQNILARDKKKSDCKKIKVEK